MIAAGIGDAMVSYSDETLQKYHIVILMIES